MADDVTTNADAILLSRDSYDRIMKMVHDYEAGYLKIILATVSRSTKSARTAPRSASTGLNARKGKAQRAESQAAFQPLPLTP
jgi:hypothetical protein